MLLVGVLLLGVNEHFHLVELVHADDAGSILASCASLTAVAGAPTAVTQRTVRQVENLVLVHTGERHFGSTDQVLLVRFAQTVDSSAWELRKPVPRITSGRTSVGVMASVKPCSSAWSTAMVSMAICMRATWPRRK